jgi:hypothetical protein
MTKLTSKKEEGLKELLDLHNSKEKFVKSGRIGKSWFIEEFKALSLDPDANIEKKDSLEELSISKQLRF